MREAGNERKAFLLGNLGKSLTLGCTQHQSMGRGGQWMGAIVARLMLLSFPVPAGSSVMSCISCFFLSFGNSESAMIALLCLFGGVSIASWNALDVLTVELYPSDKR